MNDYYTFRLVTHPTEPKYHLLIDDPAEPLGVTMCGTTTPFAEDWQDVDPANGPIEMRQMCRFCLIETGRVAGYQP